jgi:hypothetical protein
METNQIAFILIVAIVIGFGIIEYFVREKKVTEEDPTESNQKISGGSKDAISSPTDQTQQEILTQLKQINWAIRIGFLFIMLVVLGIIKPGIFG